MDFTLILQLFQLFGRLFAKGWRQVLGINLVETCVETKSALFEGSHFLEAQSHVMHRNLNQEPILGVLLEFESIEKRLSFLEETKRALILLLRYEMNCGVV